MVKLNAKQKVLLAIYTEYQKDLPNMEKNITANALGLSQDVFNVSVVKLENEGMISGTVIVNTFSNMGVLLNDTMMTLEGIDYVEKEIGIVHTLTGPEKVKKSLKMLLHGDGIK